jgi:hypothetical protein
VQDGWTSLHRASENDHTAVVKLLLALKSGEELAMAKTKVSVVGKACVWWLYGVWLMRDCCGYVCAVWRHSPPFG